jgi:hypothetical protein
MASTDTKEAVCSSALNLLGEPAIASLTADSDAARVCSQIYDNLKWSLLAQYPWGFSKKKVQLARLVATPTFGWKYQYTLPTDRVGELLAVYASSSVNASPALEFDIQDGKLLTNYSAIWIDYQYNVTEATMPPHFAQLLIYVLAFNLAYPVTEDKEKTEYWRTVAFGTPSENMRGGYFRVACSIDGRARPPEAINDFSLTDVRPV